jgi:hypothetical protein
MVRRYLLPLVVLILIFSALPASTLAGGPATTCYPQLSLVTNSIPSATAGSSYTVALAANGGQPPYSWSFGQSSLPQGFSIGANGDVSGTPATAGKYTFNVVVSDSLKDNVTGALTLTVAASPTTPPPTTPPPTTPPPTTPPPTTPPPTTPPPTTPPPTTPPPTTPPPTTPPTGPATGTALTACKDLTSSGTYYLANDVSSAGTCFAIDANNITLNLNGHTITYGTGGGSQPTPAIEGHDCWSTTNPANAGPCGSAHGGLEVYGGTIVQSANSATFSPVFSFGQGAFSSAPYIHDITATFQNTGAQFYLSAYLPTGVKIENNTIYDNVTNIQEPGQGMLSARANFQGQAIYIGQNNQNPGSGDLIENNKIVGSPQGGVRTVNQHSTISGNDISMNATYSNDFCADIPADYTTVTNNNCHPKSGRGFHINSNYVTVANNTINVIELSQNPEYGGCEGGGTYGVQLEFDNSFLPSPPVGVKVTGNTITATSAACQAIGLRVTDMTPAGNAAFTGNTITSTNNGTAQDFGISVDFASNTGVTFTGNTFNDQFAYVDGDWGGYNNTTIGHNTWLGSPTYTMYAGDGACDPTQGGTGATCPVNIQFNDSLPNTVDCGAESEATVTINGQVTQCKPNQ